VNFDLAAMVRRAKNPRRASVTLRPVIPTATMAGDLYRAVYLLLIQGWQQRLAGLEAAYSRALPTRDTLTRDAADDVQRELDAAEAWLDRLIVAITPSLKEWALKTEKWQRGKWVGAVLTATGIDLSTILSAYDVNDTVDAFMARNVALVRSVSDQTRARIADIVLRNYQTRVPVAQVAKEMAEAVDLGRARALRIAADQSSKIANRLDQARQEQARIKRYTWRHSFKRHPRRYHVERNGQVFAWSEPPSDGPPGTQPFCGCRAQALLEFK
jgi:SPP1 gp7 family putative phage head morphogenesis protein